MANRIVGNVLIIDTASGNTAVLGPASQLNKFKLGSIAFWSSDSTGNLVLSLADTTNVILRLGNTNNSPNTVGIILNGVTLQDLKVPTLTAGTAWVYLV